MKAFGGCCEDMQESLNFADGKTLNVNGVGVLFLTVAAVETDEGPGFFDIAVSFCPFCGAELQTAEEVAPGAGGVN